MTRRPPRNPVLESRRPADRPRRLSIELISDDDMVPAVVTAKREVDSDAEVSARKRQSIVKPALYEFPLRIASEGAFQRNGSGFSVRPLAPRVSLPPQTTAFAQATPGPDPTPERYRGLEIKMEELDIEPFAKLRILAREHTSMKNYIAKLEAALKRKDNDPQSSERSLHDELGRLKSQLQSQGDSHRAEVDMLRKCNVELEDGKKMLNLNIANLENQVASLEAEVSSLSLDICERKCINKGAVKDKLSGAAEPPTNLDATMKKNDKLLKAKIRHKQRIQALSAERDALRQQLNDQSEVLTRVEADLHDESFRFKLLQTQKRNLEVESRTRGNQIIELKRDLKSLRTTSHPAPASLASTQVPSAYSAPSVSNTHLLTTLGGMFTNYRTLHTKNEALWDKLWSMAKAGGFGNHGSIYRRELEGLKGVAVEELDEWKSVNGD